MIVNCRINDLQTARTTRLFSALFVIIVILSSFEFVTASTRASAQAPSHRKTIPTSMVSPSGQGSRFLAEGDALCTQWKSTSLRKAIQSYLLALTYAHRTGDYLQEAMARKKIGDVYFILSDYHKSIAAYSESLDVARKLNNTQLEVDLLNGISNCYIEMTDTRHAGDFADRAVEISTKTGNRVGNGFSLNSAGLVQFISGDPLKAQESFEQALEIFKTEGDDRGLSITLMNIGYTESNLGDNRKAMDFYDRALRLYQKTGDRRGEALMLTAMGGLNALLGEREKALGLHNQALRLFQVMGNRNGEAATRNGIGYVFDDLGEKRKALGRYQEALRLYQSSGNVNYAAITMGYIGRVFHSLGAEKTASEFYERKLAISRKVKDHRMEAYTLKDIGAVFEAVNQPDKALENYLESLKLSQNVQDKRGTAYCLISIGGLYSKRGDDSRAIERYRQALSIIQSVADRQGEITTLYSLARSQCNIGELNEARANIESSLKLIELLRTKIVSRSLRTSYLSTVYQHYEFYIDLLMRLHKQHPEDKLDRLALEISERARARTLVESLHESRKEINRGVDTALLAEEQRLREELNSMAERQVRLLNGISAPEQVAKVKNEIERLLSEYDDIQAKIRYQSPRYAALTEPPVLNSDDMQKALDPDTLMIEYSLGRERSYAWAVTSDSVSSFELKNRDEIESVATEFYDILTAVNRIKVGESRSEQAARIENAVRRYPAVALKLSSLLLKPLAAQIQRHDLVIIPDGILQYIPFGALLEPREPITVKSEPLVLNHQIVMLPSLSTLAILREDVAGRVSAPKTIAVLADPVFESNDPRLTVHKQKPTAYSTRRNETVSNGTEVTRSVEDADNATLETRFTRLPFAFEEARLVIKDVPENKRLVATSFDANLKQSHSPELSQYRIIHFATHGILDNQHPELSGIVLSLLDENGHQQDGILRLNDIYNLNLPADMIVLSACQTALGKNVKGEGLIGLTRGFMYSGAARVVASLWKINDRASAQLMGYFYEAMFGPQRLSPAAALQSAQIRMWRQSQWQFPYYWAAFVLQGEWQ